MKNFFLGCLILLAFTGCKASTPAADIAPQEVGQQQEGTSQVGFSGSANRADTRTRQVNTAASVPEEAEFQRITTIDPNAWTEHIAPELGIAFFINDGYAVVELTDTFYEVAGEGVGELFEIHIDSYDFGREQSQRRVTINGIEMIEIIEEKEGNAQVVYIVETNQNTLYFVHGIYEGFEDYYDLFLQSLNTLRGL